MADGRKAVVLLSGGMDSCVCAATACKQHGPHNVALCLRLRIPCFKLL